MKTVSVFLFLVCASSPALAQPPGGDPAVATTTIVNAVGVSSAPAETDTGETQSGDPQQGAHPAAVEYSHAYEIRAKLHKYASVATLPLFATDVALGQSLYSSSSDGKRTAHVAIGAAIGGLFAVNTVTGVWNLWEARKDPHDRTLRMLHGILMLIADAGFFATAAMAPDLNNPSTFTADKSTHRTIALTSMGIATTGYLIMLLGRH